MSNLALKWLIVPLVGALVLAVMIHTPEAEDTGDHLLLVAADDPVLTATRQRLEAHQQATHERLVYKEELIDRLIAGDMTLTEVAIEFLHTNDGTESMNAIRAHYAGSSDEEKSARNVLDFVRLRKLPKKQNDRVLTRLQREFTRAYGASHVVSH